MNHRIAMLRRFGRVAGRPAPVQPRDRRRSPPPATWRAARALAVDLGDTVALEARRVPSLDYLCAGGQMWAETGAMYCIWEDLNA